MPEPEPEPEPCTGAGESHYNGSHYRHRGESSSRRRMQPVEVPPVLSHDPTTQSRRFRRGNRWWSRGKPQRDPLELVVRCR